MKIVMFYHSLYSDWNHGNAHFLRGIVSGLKDRGEEVSVYEPENSWSYNNLIADHGESAVNEFRTYYPGLESTRYCEETLDLDSILSGAGLVIVHEWNSHSLVKRIGDHKKGGADYKLLFHDTHHRAATEIKSMASYDLSGYDGVLAYGGVIRDIYINAGWVKKAWTWHEAADTRVFYPYPGKKPEGDIVWIGNWGDGERTEELFRFLINPVKELKLKCTVYGVRYPQEAIDALDSAGIHYGGWLPNYKVPGVFSKFKLTVHVPRRPYVSALPGIPTIRPFEALACGMPLISSPWNDTESLFNPGKDFLFAKDGIEMREIMELLLENPAAAEQLSVHGAETITKRHTCAHRVNELYGVYEELNTKKTFRITV
jgi:spore maturation protein CgeB